MLSSFGTLRVPEQDKPGRSKSFEPLRQKPSNTGEDFYEGDEPVWERPKKEARHAASRIDDGHCNNRIDPL